MRIDSLLNHDPRESDEDMEYVATGSRAAAPGKGRKNPSDHAPKANSNNQAKKPKSAKEVPKFVEGNPVGTVLFPPHVPNSDRITDGHDKLKLHPSAEDISKYPVYIPYKCEKRDFFKKTGLVGFHAFQYTFDNGAYEAPWVVLWDYQHGLVRMTPFFKALDMAKTVPKAAIDNNGELKDVCFNITGGSMLAQGYWVPYDAAKALAATFCYDIRYALTPVFGNDFPKQCVRPKDNKGKGQKFMIDAAVVDAAVAATLAIKATLVGSKPRTYADSDAETSESEAEYVDHPVSSKVLRPRNEKTYAVEVDESELSSSDEYSSPFQVTRVGSKWVAANAPKMRPVANTSRASVSRYLSSLPSVTTTADRPTSADTSVDAISDRGSATYQRSRNKAAGKRKLESFQHDMYQQEHDESTAVESSEEIAGTIFLGKPSKEQLMRDMSGPKTKSAMITVKIAVGDESPRMYRVSWPQIEALFKAVNPDCEAAKLAAAFARPIIQDGTDLHEVLESERFKAALSLVRLKRLEFDSNRKWKYAKGNRHTDNGHEDMMKEEL